MSLKSISGLLQEGHTLAVFAHVSTSPARMVWISLRLWRRVEGNASGLETVVTSEGHLSTCNVSDKSSILWFHASHTWQEIIFVASLSRRLPQSWQKSRGPTKDIATITGTRKEKKVFKSWGCSRKSRAALPRLLPDSSVGGIYPCYFLYNMNADAVDR